MPAIGFSGTAAVIEPSRDNLTIAGVVGITTYLGLLSRSGILVKDGRVLEMLTEVDTVVSGKTGTLTEETPIIGRILTVSANSNELLRLAATDEHRQMHPIARAIRRRAEAAGITAGEPEHLDLRLGHGLAARIDGRRILVGSARFPASEGVTLPTSLEHLAADCHDTDTALLHVTSDGVAHSALELCTRPRSGAATLCERLRSRGLTLVIISGDQAAPTQQLAVELGITQVFARPCGRTRRDQWAMIAD